MSVHEKMTAIADAIRDKTGGTEKLGLDAMAVGVCEVYEAGKQAGYDAVWDTIQSYGERNNYMGAFREWRSAVTITPKYLIATSTLYTIFTACTKLETLPTITCSNADGRFTHCYDGFAGCSSLKSIDFDISVSTSGSAAWQNAFLSCGNLKRIQKLGVLATQTFPGTFNQCSALEEIRFEGEIGQNGLNLQWSTKLSGASITSVINALSTTTSGLSITLSKTAVESAFGSTTADAWTALIATRSNWTISLV